MSDKQGGESKGGLNLTYGVMPDENGVFDGVELAAELIRDAYSLLLPYADTCPACADKLFTVLANREIEEVLQSGDHTGMVLAACPEPERPAAVQAHMQAAEVRTRELLKAARAAGHDHG